MDPSTICTELCKLSKGWGQLWRSKLHFKIAIVQVEKIALIHCSAVYPNLMMIMMKLIVTHRAGPLAFSTKTIEENFSITSRCNVFSMFICIPWIIGILKIDHNSCFDMPFYIPSTFACLSEMGNNCQMIIEALSAKTTQVTFLVKLS